MAFSQHFHFDIQGWVGRYLKAATDQWLLVAPLANPAMLEMFADRDTPPYRNLMPWAGEFAGKYLTSAVLTLRVTGDERLRSLLEQFVPRLISLQDSDGYLGPWPKEARLTNYSLHHGQNGLATWDTWGHYHIMTGLLLWFETTGDHQALDCVCRIADMICEKYLAPGEQDTRLVDTGSTEMNLAPVHALARLHRISGVERYLAMALQIVEEFAAQGAPGPDGQPVPLAGDYLNQALAEKALYQMPRPRWESLHAIMGLVELYHITGEEHYRRAFENIWWGIVEFDRHNNGGFSSGEQAVGSPYDPGTIETCCTIAWVTLSVEMLHLTRSSIVADEVELSTLNSVLGMHSPTGRWATFTTPMDGARFANAHAIVFQSRSGSPELNCCSVNSPRGLGMVSQWAALSDLDGITLNYYGPSIIWGGAVFSTQEEEAISQVTIRQETDYPLSGQIRVLVEPLSPCEFTLRLRIPYWSQNTRLHINGQSLEGVSAGEYYEIRRTWQASDVVDLVLDMGPHFWQGERQCQGLSSAFHGPLLLAYDQRYNRHILPKQFPAIPDDPFKVLRENLPVPTLQARQMGEPVNATDLAEWGSWHPPFLLVETRTPEGQPVFLCDFASAGQTGTLYRSWLPWVDAPQAARFTRANPLRSIRSSISSHQPES